MSPLVFSRGSAELPSSRALQAEEVPRSDTGQTSLLTGLRSLASGEAPDSGVLFSPDVPAVHLTYHSEESHFIDENNEA